MNATDSDPIHIVTNQSTPLEDYDSFLSDRVLCEAVYLHGAGWAQEQLSDAGRAFASGHAFRQAAFANQYVPQLHTHDRHGRRRDEVEFHPAWHELLAGSIGRGIVSLPFADGAPAGSQVARAALFFLHAQMEAGTQCPLAMSFGSVPVLQRFAGDLRQIESLWLPKLLSRQYDPRPLPAHDKAGALFGMGMTERQGGSDVRTNLSRATPVKGRGSGQRYTLRGHKWFFSAPMCDAFLMLAQADGGISCFLVPRLRDDGSLNGICLLRLKDKLGNRSNASVEIELHDSEAHLLGEEGRGVPVIIEMATYTRLDCVIATAGMQRRALGVALHHAARREAFGAALIEQPLMRAVLTDLAVESEASTRLAMYLASCYEPAAPEGDRLIGRLLTSAAKFHVCRRGPQFAAEALEVLGGNGYVEEQDLARIYRELPLLSIWEGSGNVMCLDVLRSVAREPDCVTALLEKLEAARGENDALDACVERLARHLAEPAEEQARAISHDVTFALQAVLLLQHAPEAVSRAFCRTRLQQGEWGASFGTLPPGIDARAILEHARPVC